jgi:hypothetical protein
MAVVDEFPSTTSINMPVEGDVQGSRVPEATRRGKRFLDVRHK